MSASFGPVKVEYWRKAGQTHKRNVQYLNWANPWTEDSAQGPWPWRCRNTILPPTYVKLCGLGESLPPSKGGLLSNYHPRREEGDDQIENDRWICFCNGLFYFRSVTAHWYWRGKPFLHSTLLSWVLLWYCLMMDRNFTIPYICTKWYYQIK